ncbi:response regulator transcription factor [Vallitalea guaymasensis]|uniref:Stage 0 sporulation protein A homolog n=1 Tax=Vallitalea guaymasensis TaxID=1185412 RepID=A0A8J8M7A3_9FIRM|nr:response regulator transcription factor [Vallitalea guaymasensis]QUH27538.1 response regulator transcription factor [Vallitalea guaymasensis]
MEKIIVADDELEIRELIKVCLENEGYEVVTVKNGKEAVEAVDSSVGLIILDVMMPIMNGIMACNEIRKKSSVPIIFLTAKTQDSDMIFGLSAGADDYIKKPFTPPILIAKIKAVLRRYRILGADAYEDKSDKKIYVKDLVIDIESHNVIRENKEIHLTKTEFDILLLLANHKGQVFSIERIYESVWNEAYIDVSANTVMVHIKKLRNKIKNTEQNEYIKTVWGVGYKIEK